MPKRSVTSRPFIPEGEAAIDEEHFLPSIR